MENNVIEKINWDLLSKSPTINPYLYTIVKNIPTMFFKSGFGFYFLIIVSEEYLPEITLENSATLLKMEPRIAGDVVIGRFIKHPNGKSPEGWWPIADNDDLLKTFVGNSVKHFSHLINNYSQWPSFADYLFFDIDYNVELDFVKEQAGLTYWWLTSELIDNKIIHKVSISDEEGVFIKPHDGLLPVFTSSLYADMASQIWSKKYGVELEIRNIPCLGCILNALSNEIGPDKIRGAILNEQWNINFYKCAEKSRYGISMHFFLEDTKKYSLIGCKEKTFAPIWCERKWDVDHRYFAPSCNPVEW